MKPHRVWDVQFDVPCHRTGHLRGSNDRIRLLLFFCPRDHGSGRPYPGNNGRKPRKDVAVLCSHTLLTSLSICVLDCFLLQVSYLRWEAADLQYTAFFRSLGRGKAIGKPCDEKHSQQNLRVLSLRTATRAFACRRPHAQIRSPKSSLRTAACFIGTCSPTLIGLTPLKLTIRLCGVRLKS